MSMTVEEKIKVLKNTAVKSIEKKFGENSYFLGEKKISKVPLICSSGSLSLDNALVIGGFPEGRIIEIGGQESSSKTTLTLINIAEIQKQGKLCAFIDVEQSFDPEWAMKMGVDVDNLLTVQPDTAEEAFSTLYDIIDSGVVSYIVVDSTNSMIPKKLFESENVGDASMGLGARLFSQELPRVRTKCTNTKCTVVFLSQMRSSISAYSGDIMGVGNALKYYCSLRIKTARADVEKDDGEEGQKKVDVVMTVIKNKVGVPWKKARFTLLTGENGRYGIDTNKEIIEFAVKYDLVKKAGSWYSYNDEKIGQGIENVRKYFEEHPELFDLIKKQIFVKFEEEREKNSISKSMTSAITEAVENNTKVKKRRGETPIEVKAEEVIESEVVEEKKED